MRVNPGVLALSIMVGRVDVIERIAADVNPPAGEHSKTCRLCQRPHSHHNLFCSAECYREHRRRARERAS